MNRVKIFDWDDLPDRQPAHALVANVDLVVVRYDDRVSVLYGRCHHRGALLADGRVEGSNLYCGVHNWDYRYETGISEYDNAERLHAFTSWVEDNGVWVDADEIAATFNSLHDAGKVRYFGVSNFTPSQFALLQSRLDVPLVTNQIEFSVLHPEPLFDGTLDQLQQRRVAPQAWSPYAGGRIFNGEDAQAQRVRDTLAALSAKYNDAAPDHLALAWLLAHPTRVQPVLGTGKLARVDSALKALDITLERDDWFALLEASQGAPVP